MTGNKNECISYLLGQNDEEKFDIAKHKEKRSLDQNAYVWKLITEIGNVLRKSKEEVYLQMLKDYGQMTSIMLLEEIDIKKYYKYYELESKREIKGKRFNIYKIYMGSSNFDTKEMSIFIDGVVEEAKQLDIETLTPEQLSLLREKSL